MDPISAILGLINIGGGIFGGLSSRNSAAQQQRWIQNALVEVAQRARSGEDWARTMMQQVLDPAYQASLSGINLAGNQLWNGDQLAQTNSDFYNSLPGMFENPMFNTPAMEAARSRMEPLADNAGARGDVSWERFMNGGRTPEFDTIFGNIGNYAAGRGSNSQLEQQNVGADLLSHRGQTAYTQGYQDRGMDALNNGGMNPYLEAALTKAATMLQEDGMTPETEAAFQEALGLIASGGENAQTSLAQAGGLNKALQDTVIPYNELRRIAGEGATNQLQSSLGTLYKNAANRGGGPGVTIGNGLNSSEFTDFLNFAPSVRANAENAAAGQWMDAAQKDASLGASLFGQGGNLALGRMNTGAGLLGTAQSGQNQRLNTALGAIPGTQNSATQIMSTLGNLGLGALGAENSRIGLGAGLANDFNNGVMGFNSLYGNTASNMNNYGLNSGQLSNSFMNTGLSANNSLFGNDLSAAQFAVARATAQSQAQSNALGLRNALFGQFSSNYNNGINQLNNQGGMYGDYARATMPNQNPYGAYSRQNTGFQMPETSGLSGILGGIFGQKKPQATVPWFGL